MKAVLLRDFGGPEVLRLEEVEVPSPRPGEVLVRVHSVSVNRWDLGVREGTYARRPSLPAVLGLDPAGVVVATGPRVEGSQVGERVAVFSAIPCGACHHCRSGDAQDCPESQHIGVHRWGGYAQYVAVPAGNAFTIPPALSFAEATVVSRHCSAAFHLARRADLGPAEWALVMGAAGALGSCVVQVARLLAAKVIAGAGSDARVEAALSYGAHFGVNYRRQDLAAEVMRITGGLGAAVVFENIADPTLWPGAFSSLAYGGRLVTAGAHGGGQVTLDVARLYNHRLRIIGAAGGGREDVLRALEAAAAGQVQAAINRVMPLGEAAEAHRLLEQNGVVGKLILNPTL